MCVEETEGALCRGKPQWPLNNSSEEGGWEVSEMGQLSPSPTRPGADVECAEVLQVTGNMVIVTGSDKLPGTPHPSSVVVGLV